MAKPEIEPEEKKKMDVQSYFMCSPLISEAGSLNKRSCLAAALGATKSLIKFAHT